MIQLPKAVFHTLSSLTIAEARSLYRDALNRRPSATWQEARGRLAAVTRWQPDDVELHDRLRAEVDRLQHAETMAEAS